MSRGPALRVIAIRNGRFDQNCYLVGADGCADAGIVDPGEETDLVLERAREEGLAIKAIWITHAHIDHVLGVARIHAATDAPIHLHPADRPLYDRVGQQAEFFGVRADDLPRPTHDLVHGQELSVGEARLIVRHTPGHSPGSVCFSAPGLVFVGDVLLRGTLGRSDLPGGSHERLVRSVKEELFGLPDETLVYCGHGPVTTIGIERRDNPFLRTAPDLPG